MTNGLDQHRAAPATLAEAAADPATLGRVRSVLTLSGLPWGDLEDAVQQVRLKALEQAGKESDGGIRNVSAWLTVVASRVAVDWHRSRKRDHQLSNLIAAQMDTKHQVTEDDRTLALTVADALDELPPLQRQVIVLRYYADLKVGDIAELLDVPIGTVKSRIHHATAAIGVRLSTEDSEEGTDAADTAG